MTSSNRTKIRELYSVCKNSSLLGIQRDRQKDNHNLQKTFLHLTTDNFSLKTGVCKLTTLKFPLLLFVAYFFSIWATYFCEVYKLFSYPLTIRCWLFGKILRAFLIFVTDFFSKAQPENVKKIIPLSGSRRNKAKRARFSEIFSPQLVGSETAIKGQYLAKNIYPLNR